MVRRICFVSFEVSPFTGGGIGTWLRNTLDTYANHDCVFDVLYYGDKVIDEFAFERRFPGVRFHEVNMSKPRADLLPVHGPMRSSGLDTVSQWRSYVLAMALKKLERETGPYDLIEFTDWGGPAFYSIQEKKLGAAFQSTSIAVRLHGSEGMLRSVEHRCWSFENLVLEDLERLALRDADLIVAHLQTILDAYKELYGFDDNWPSKAAINIPPIVNKITRDQTIQPSSFDAPILFTSKIQSVKRPDTFIRGCMEFARADERYHGEFVFLAFNADQALRDRIDSEIPKSLQPRVRFVVLTDQEQRESIISDGVAVFPGIYESFCYAAYEASRAGAIVVLNQANPAFGDNTPWVDGVNCLKFDGTAHGLSLVLENLFRSAQNGDSHCLSPVNVEHSTCPYWESAPMLEEGAMSEAFSGSDAGMPRVSVVIPHRNQGHELAQTLSSLLTEQAVPLEIIVVDDASENPDTEHILEQLGAHENLRVASLKIVRRKSIGGYAVMVNSVLSLTHAPTICILSPGDRITPGFLGRAVETLVRHTNCAAIVPAAAVVEHPGDAKPVAHFMPLGEPLATGLFVNRACNTVLICQRGVLNNFTFDESMTGEWNWDLTMRLIQAGFRVLTSAETGVEIPLNNFHRYAWNSENARRQILDVIHRRFATEGTGWRLPLTVIGDGETTSIGRYESALNVPPTSGEECISAVEELMQLKSATSVRIALGIAGRVKNMTPWLYRPARRILRSRLNN